MSPESPSFIPPAPETPHLSLVPPIEQTPLVARPDGSNPLLNTPEEAAAAAARQVADGRTAELQQAMDTYDSEQPFVDAAPVEEAIPALPQSLIDSQNLIRAAADSVRRWSEGLRTVQTSPGGDPDEQIIVPDFVKTPELTQPVQTPETPPQQ